MNKNRKSTFKNNRVYVITFFLTLFFEMSTKKVHFYAKNMVHIYIFHDLARLNVFKSLSARYTSNVSKRVSNVVWLIFEQFLGNRLRKQVENKQSSRVIVESS